MGDPKKTCKQFEKPMRVWDKPRIEKESVVMSTFGLKNKRQLWRFETILRKKRKSARELLALPGEERAKRERELTQSLASIGLLQDNATLENVLTLSVESLLERRLQTLVWRNGLANSVKQARQFITHGHIAIDGKKVTVPSYLVKVSEEKKIGYYKNKKMVLQPTVVEKKKREKMKKEFKEATGKEAREATAEEGKEKEAKAEGEKIKGEKAEEAKEESEKGKKGVEKKEAEPAKEGKEEKEKAGEKGGTEEKKEEKAAPEGKKEEKAAPGGKKQAAKEAPKKGKREGENAEGKG